MGATEYEKLKGQLISLFNDNTDAILLLNMEGIILDANPAFLELASYEKQEVVNRHFQELITNEVGEEEDRQLSLHEYYFLDRRFRLIAKDNMAIRCLMRLNPIREDGCLTGYFLIMKSMLELDKIAERYLESELNYRRIAENIQDVLILMDQHQNYLYVSPSSKEILGFDNTHMDDGPFFTVHADYVEEFEDKLKAAFEKGEPFKIRLKAYSATREWLWLELKGKAIHDQEGKFLHILLTVRDVSKEQQQKEHLKYFAYHDMLTGLPNRRMFSNQLDEAVAMLSKQQTPFALMLLDVDNFKQINDSYGHEIGDQVIIEMALRLQETIGTQGLVARLGGDEFVILLPNVGDGRQLEGMAQRINDAVGEGINIQQAHLEVTVSIGIAVCTKPPLTARQALRHADEALYKGKNLGKNTFTIYRTEG
ncbi:MAG: diguanylate cyclase domain-containing protein [Lysinibacillus sp.]